MVAVTTDAWRGTGPRPTGKGDDFLFLTVARGPVPRDHPRAPVTVVRDRLISNGSRSGDLDLQRRDKLSVPPRSAALGEKRPQLREHGCFLLRPGHGEGQALALR